MKIESFHCNSTTSRMHQSTKRLVIRQPSHATRIHNKESNFIYFRAKIRLLQAENEYDAPYVIFIETQWQYARINQPNEYKFKIRTTPQHSMNECLQMTPSSDEARPLQAKNEQDKIELIDSPLFFVLWKIVTREMGDKIRKWQFVSQFVSHFVAHFVSHFVSHFPGVSCSLFASFLFLPQSIT